MSVNVVTGTTGSAQQVDGQKKTYVNNEPVSIMEFDAGKTNNTIDVDLVSTDGSNDGKLSGGEVAKLAVKGAGEDVKNALTSPLGIIGIIGVTALSICPVTAPFVAPLAVAGAALGIGAGVVKTVSGISKITSAETDAEAKGGAKEMGSGIYTTGTSAAAMKASLNQMAKVEGSHMEAAYRDGTSKTRAYFQDVKEMATEFNPFPRKGNLSQKEIDEMFKSYEAEQAQIEANADTNMSQADIDELLASNGLGPNAAKDNLSQADIDALLRELGAGPEYPTDVMSQVDIDNLLAQNGLGPNAASSAASEATQGEVLKFGQATASSQASYTEKLNMVGKILGIPDDEVAQLPEMIKWFDANGGDHTTELLPNIINAYKAAHQNTVVQQTSSNPLLDRLLELAGGEDLL